MTDRLRAKAERVACGKPVGDSRRVQRAGYAVVRSVYVCVLPPNHEGPCSAAIGAPAHNAQEGSDV